MKAVKCACVTQKVMVSAHPHPEVQNEALATFTAKAYT